MLPALIAVALAGEPGATARVSEALWRLAADGEGLAPDCARPEPLALTVVLELDPYADPVSLRRALAPVAEIEEWSGLWVQVRVDTALLPELAYAPGVARVRLPRCASPKEVVSEGVAAIDPSAWVEAGLSGEGVRVAILDVGFAGFEATDEIPDSTVLAAGDVGSSNHGLAVAEVIHDLAPGAELLLYQFSTDVEYAARMNQIAEDDIDVVNASVGFDNVAHADGNSTFAQLVDALVAQRVVYVAAAGNEVGRYRIGALTDEDGDGYVELDGADPIEIEGYFSEVEASLRWSEPFGQASVDLDLELYQDGVLCDRSAELQRGDGDPYERAVCASNGGVATARIHASGGLPSGLRGWLYAPAGVSDQDAAAVAGTLTLPADARGALSVGAYDLNTGSLLSYSSHGPTDDGRLKPDLAAPANVSTAALGREGFSGSSAAAPHAAGLAALLRDRRHRLRPDRLSEALIERAEDRGVEGPDTGWGAGVLQAGEVPRRCGCGGESTEQGLFVAGILLAARRRTKRPLASGPRIP